ncbi:hypothetical protein, partial [Burkholderia singularis]|uniref:hypothetical protein n=1 Tax=Burkholderia singularis TaxID=1503053 RepID=UPI001C4858F0
PITSPADHRPNRVGEFYFDTSGEITSDVDSRYRRLYGSVASRDGESNPAMILTLAFVPLAPAGYGIRAALPARFDICLRIRVLVPGGVDARSWPVFGATPPSQFCDKI